jgi:hypothetical protein
MDWNSFNRELQNRVSDPGLRYMLGLMYERQLDMSKQLDMCSEICNQLANTIQGIVGLHEVLDERLRALNRHVKGRDDGISVSSEPITNN